MDQKKRLRAEQRLRNQAAFKNLVARGNFARGEFFYVWAGSQKVMLPKTGKGRPMIGIVVNRKTDSRATKRNFLKRRIREIFRKNQGELKNAAAYLVKMRPVKEAPSYAAMEEELLRLFKKTGVLA